MKHLIVVAHPRSGTHLAIDTIRNNFPEYFRPYVNLDALLPDHARPISIEEMARTLGAGPRVIKTHMPPDLGDFALDSERRAFVESLLSRSRIIYVYRDGRDVLTSLFHFSKEYLGPDRSDTFSDFIRGLTPVYHHAASRRKGTVTYWVEHVTGWINRDDVITIRFRDLLYDPQASIRKLAECAALDMPDRIKSVTLRSHSSGHKFKSNRMTIKVWKLVLRLVRRVELTATSFRSGRTGDFENHFTEEDLVYFELEAAEIMDRLGYTWKRRVPLDLVSYS